MTESPLPFALPDLGEAEIEAVTDAIRSGWVSSGPQVKAFEDEFAALCGDGVTAVTVNSATAGLHLALEAIGIGPGDEVLVPTWTFTATAEVVRYLGAEPVLVDVDPRTFNIDLGAAAAAVTPRTRAIMPVHFAGLPVSPSALRDFAVTHGVRVVEDAAHALPAAAEGEMVGSGASDATVFSFYATKTITTGEGGMVVSRNAEVTDRIKVMRLHGISRDAFDRYRSSVPSWQYEVIAPGYKYNLTDPAAAMGRVQLARAREMRDRRAAIAARYDEAFADTDLQLPDHGPEGTLHAWHLYVVRVPQGDDRDGFIRAMSERGIGTSVHFIPLHKHPYWRDRGALTDDQFPQASAEFERVVSLPVFSSMTDAQVERVVEAVTALRSA
ncbi:DegT/DnrJ/EryC1/StrS aminotransferase family protein [Nocardioides sp. Y6]|uniref:DegT/DnrJ/EryC1/StrS aminotransferase family protein n=1 Tax=Nocardioides malaquae TaxID=2773426 RepID=A0ABR9RTD3_9ACTN|nr:DegT/DnrJ/EryC1/StrS family aminotransferase [Nocardioides malaquae]MBE7324822.1 DegT/DnrJ/EryC1/StrS aminotransferase family protein [Nocardioides malaquae]